MQKNIIRFLLIAAIGTGIALSALYRDQIQPEKIQTMLENSGMLAPVLFMLFFAAGTVLFAPGSIFALYVALYCLGRALIETIRIDEANLIFGVRLNVWTSVVLLFASLIYLRQNQLPKESSVK